MLDLFWSLKKCEIYQIFFRSSCFFLFKNDWTYATESNQVFFFGFSKKIIFFSVFKRRILCSLRISIFHKIWENNKIFTTNFIDKIFRFEHKNCQEYFLKFLFFLSNSILHILKAKKILFYIQQKKKKFL